jgi:acetylornithine/succinyldiaminopimelate/putrescine aminotransferase
MIAVEFDSFDTNKKIIDALIEQGIFTDWFLFASNCLRIAPPLTISETVIKIACEKIIEVVNTVTS